jgi:hypothetical protein
MTPRWIRLALALFVVSVQSSVGRSSSASPSQRRISSVSRWLDWPPQYGGGTALPSLATLIPKSPLQSASSATGKNADLTAAPGSKTEWLGLLCLTAFAVAIIARLWRLARLTDARALAWSLAASPGGYAIDSATTFVVYQVLLMWLLLALTLTAAVDPVAET